MRNRHYDRLVSGMQKLAASGKVQAGVMVYLDAAPLRLLQEAPLAEGKWLDRAVVELAEWGAAMRDRGYHAEEAQDGHPLAPGRFVGEDGEEADQGEAQELRRKAAASLKKFPGKTRKIDGRLYLSFEDHCRWRGRKVKGDLKSGVKQGIVTASWNAWVEAQGEKATVAGMTVARLRGCVEDSPYYVCSSGIEQRLARREQLLESIRADSKESDAEAMLLPLWKKGLERLLAEVIVFRGAIGIISRHYYEGHQVLLADYAGVLEKVVNDVEKIAGAFHDTFSGKGDQPQERIDLEALRSKATKEAPAQAAEMADMARMEALEFMGEHQAALEVARRYV